jgi:hypothetical protein
LFFAGYPNVARWQVEYGRHSRECGFTSTVASRRWQWEWNARSEENVDPDAPFYEDQLSGFNGALAVTELDNKTLTPGALPETVAISCGRAVLVVPHVGIRRKPGKSIMLCWNAGRATTAVSCPGRRTSMPKSCRPLLFGRGDTEVWVGTWTRAWR